MVTPSANGANGRGPNGRFAKGNLGGPGNPHASRTARLRAMLLDNVTDDDFKTVVAKLVAMAKGGDLAAIRELLDRMMGKPKATIELERAEFDEAELDREIENALEQLADLRKTQAAGPGK